MRPRTSALSLGVLAIAVTASADDGTFAIRLRQRVEDKAHPGRFSLVERPESWNPRQTAIIVCDMWDLHHCLNATKRGAELAPAMDRVLKCAREKGTTIIHAPSDCVDHYTDHPARKRVAAVPKSKHLPDEIGTWCYKIPNEEKGVYPIDQSDGGEDDDPKEHADWAAKLSAMGRNPKAPWKSQTDLLTIDGDKDYISANGEEVWSILEERGIKNVVLLGVHLNMCVLGRPFGLRQMAKNGRNVVLMRDMTDTMYNPAMPPKVSHFAGTDLMVEHVEKYVCPTIASNQIVGGEPFHFSTDKRPHVVMVVAEDEYQTEASLPAFASKWLANDFRVSVALGDATDRNAIQDLGTLKSADAVLVSVRRRVLPKDELEAIQRYAASGRPIVGIRTASHAFSPRGDATIPEGRAAWTTFDPDILGGHYSGHHVETAHPKIAQSAETRHPILDGVDVSKIAAHGSLYKVSPLAPSTTVLAIGSIPGEAAEPVAWINAPKSGNRVFYTSLGQIDDFANPDFERLLRNGIAWAATGH